MSAKNSINDASAKQGMKGWRGLHVGMIQCMRSPNKHRKWRYGRKKGTRRARRRLDKEVIQTELASEA